MTINEVCGSGLKAVMLAAQAIRDGDADIVIAGGQENMSAAPHVLPGSRDGQRMGDWKLVDTMIVDGLWDVYNQYHMGITAENVAKKYDISREQQDEFALASQNKAEAAQKAGRFKDEIVAGHDPADARAIRSSSTPTSSSTRQDQRRSARRPAAGVRQGRHGDRRQCLGPQRRRRGRGRHDGARRPQQLGLKPLARIAATRPSGVDPAIMGMGPVPASKQGAASAPAGRPPTST